MLRFLCALAVVAISLAGCATYPDVHRQRLEALPQHYAQFDAVLGWEIRDAGPQTIIDGEFRNARYATMTNIEVWVAALDQGGHTLARSASFILPRKLGYNETAPFSLKLNVPAVPGTKLRFTYKYMAIEGAGNEGGSVGNWIQSFDTIIPAR